MTLFSFLWRHEMWLRQFLLLVLTCASVYLCIAIFWAFTTPVARELPPITSVHPHHQQSTPTISADFFGALPVANQANKPAKKTRLNLTLKGVIPATEMQNSLAIITSRGNIDDVYQVGDSIIAGVILQEVYADHIIIKRGDKLESLHFAENKLKTLVETTPISNNELAAPAQKSFPKPFPKQGESNSPVVTQVESQQTKGLETSLPTGPNTPIGQDDLASLMGLQLAGNAYEVLDSSALLSVGLKAGDKIVAINGLSVGALQNGQNFGAIIRQQDVAMLQILRGSRSFSVRYPIN
ncbi:hypothetical protein CBF23_002695 [Marinomonas agarivorans]|nr:hypothetical protein CBF23_002695 [Marinomonas agarivorans]